MLGSLDPRLDVDPFQRKLRYNGLRPPIFVADEATGWHLLSACVHCGAEYGYDWEQMRRTTATPQASAGIKSGAAC